MPNSWIYLAELQSHKPGTLAKILKNNAPKYVKEQIKKLIKEGKIKSFYELARIISEKKEIILVFKELGIENKERKFGKGSIRCIICGSHDRVIRKYNIYLCGRCFREWSKIFGFEVKGE
ncbi:MAG: 30S ribosomal protein S14 [Nanopusillaceae archaeon]